MLGVVSLVVCGVIDKEPLDSAGSFLDAVDVKWEQRDVLDVIENGECDWGMFVIRGWLLGLPSVVEDVD